MKKDSDDNLRNRRPSSPDLDEESDDEHDTGYICTTCKAHFQEWVVGQCTKCGAWGSILAKSEYNESDEYEDFVGARPIDEISEDNAIRIPTGITELDRVLGGGAVLGCVTLVGGDPGVGKSTLLLQALASLSALGKRTLYVTAEESANQVAARARRIENVIPKNLLLMAETRVEVILDEIRNTRPMIVVIDSVQTIHNDTGSAGSVSQIRDVTSAIVEVARAQNICTFLVGHVTKDRELAGPKVLEHLVDTVLAFEGERGQAFRTLRTQKNRYGSSTEVGIFEMTAKGMQEVPNASEFFLAERNEEAPGSIIAATSESNRSMLVEVQALVGAESITGGKVTATGISTTRLNMIIGVLAKCLQGKSIASRDIFVNIAGGMSISEPALDLPIALAIASSMFQTPIHSGLVAFGEIGLTGEIRGVPRVPTRLAEATTMGFQGAIVPRSVAGKESKKARRQDSLEILPVRTLDEAITIALPERLSRKQAKTAQATKTEKRSRRSRDS